MNNTANPPDPKKNADLPTRFAAGIVMIAVAGAAVYFSGWPFRLLGAVAAALMIVEWADMHRVPRMWRWTAVVMMVVPLIGFFEYFFRAAEHNIYQINYDLVEPVLTVFAAVAGLALLIALFTRRIAMGWGFLYVGVPSAALIFINWAWWQLSLWVLIVTWATDIFAYFAGRAIGGPKLAPRTSPNKTWAGLLGGMAGAGAAGWLAAHLLELDTAIFFWLGAPMGLLAQLGDLYESSVKRRRGVKDSGTILPGHGGVLDRLDGLLPVALATFVVLLVLSRGTA
jgi:phosphatidate cytidylyltransferase